MKSLIISSIFALLFANLSLADTHETPLEPPVVEEPPMTVRPGMTYITRNPCDNVIDMTTLITEKYKEKLLFTGLGGTFDGPSGALKRGGLMFFTNQDTGTFTIVQVFSDGISCMLMNGNQFSPYSGAGVPTKETF